MKDFRDLQVWQKAHELTVETYRVTVVFPKREMYGITSQMRRCAPSVAANIAEGCGKRGNNEFQRFLQIASGSASELDYHLLLARDLNFIHGADYERLMKQLTELRRMLTALLQKVDRERNATKC